MHRVNFRQRAFRGRRNQGKRTHGTREIAKSRTRPPFGPNVVSLSSTLCTLSKGNFLPAYGHTVDIVMYVQRMCAQVPRGHKCTTHNTTHGNTQQRAAPHSAPRGAHRPTPTRRFDSRRAPLFSRTHSTHTHSAHSVHTCAQCTCAHVYTVRVVCSTPTVDTLISLTQALIPFVHMYVRTRFNSRTRAHTMHTCGANSVTACRSVPFVRLISGFWSGTHRAA